MKRIFKSILQLTMILFLVVVFSRSYAADTFSKNHIEKIQKHIVPLIVYKITGHDNPYAEVGLELRDDGKIISIILLNSSGNQLWNSAVLNALSKVEFIPVDDSGFITNRLRITFRPK